MSEPIFKVENLKKDYGNKTVLDIDQLSFEKGLITSVIGPSGAGKSTLLHLLNGIEKPTFGDIWFENNKFNRAELSLAIRREMVMVFQKPLVFTSSVFDNLAYGLKLRGTDKKEIKSRVDEMLTITGLKDKSHQKATTLSGGEAQRVAIGRAMIVRPKAILLDEPTANLDPANITVIEDLIRYGKQHYGLSVIIVTHNMFQAKRLSDRTLFMMNGKQIEYDGTEKLFTNPDNEMTGDFIKGKIIF